MLRLQSLLDEGLRREETEDDEMLGILRTASIDAFEKSPTNAIHFWLQVLEAKPKEFANGVTFKVSPYVPAVIRSRSSCRALIIRT